MGEAKRKISAVSQALIVYHWTSSIKLGAIRADGYLDIEKPNDRMINLPDGTLALVPGQKRSYRDYPGLVWFTRQRHPPATMAWSNIAEQRFGARRVGLAFDAKAIGATLWPDYFGANTETGQAFSASATRQGDDPLDWWICEQPVSIRHCLFEVSP